ncbi:DUF317 domain-containing protein [Streptomyces sp. NPDC057623]|uniref:DUF317 domain-containing protein n=1 Tax=Streptomyces sp. NPDC057623 TaxID=3346187 RepID=UPI0036915012
MTPPAIDAHVRLDAHPTHTSAVTAILTGTRQDLARPVLTAHGFETLNDHALVMARIDREEPHWADTAAQALAAQGITTQITDRLREAIDEEWTWASHPTPWCTRQEIREISNEANRIYDDIRHGRLLIHAHAEDGHTTVAIGTYLDSGKSVYLRGEDHLRQIADSFDSLAQALTAFEHLHADTMRPGPAPLTDTEREAAQARTSLGTPPAEPEPPVPEPEIVPAHAADPGNHEAALNTFLTDNGDWERYNTWDDNTTVATHESLTLRILFDHEAHARDAQWTIAAYETPVSDRMWHMTITPATPQPILDTLLTALSHGDVWETALGTPITDKTVAQATRPLADAGWTPTVDGHRLRWQTQPSDVGVQFDAFAANAPHRPLDTWTIWSGPSIDQPTWAIRASVYTPAGLLADLAEELAHGTGTRRPRSPGTPRQPPQPTTVRPAAAPPGPQPQAGRPR